jgi:hypothetical protein
MICVQRTSGPKLRGRSTRAWRPASAGGSFLAFNLNMATALSNDFRSHLTFRSGVVCPPAKPVKSTIMTKIVFIGSEGQRTKGNICDRGVKNRQRAELSPGGLGIASSQPRGAAPAFAAHRQGMRTAQPPNTRIPPREEGCPHPSSSCPRKTGMKTSLSPNGSAGKGNWEFEIERLGLRNQALGKLGRVSR